MNLKRSFLTVTLALGLLLPSVVGAAEPVQRSTDDQGTIRIDNPKPANNEPAGEKAGAAKAAPGSTAAGPATPAEPPPPGLLPTHSRRLGGPAAEARKKAFEKAHPNLIQTSPSPPTQLEQQPLPKSPQ